MAFDFKQLTLTSKQQIFEKQSITCDVQIVCKDGTKLSEVDNVSEEQVGFLVYEYILCLKNKLTTS